MLINGLSVASYQFRYVQLNKTVNEMTKKYIFIFISLKH